MNSIGCPSAGLVSPSHATILPSTLMGGTSLINSMGDFLSISCIHLAVWSLIVLTRTLKLLEFDETRGDLVRACRRLEALAKPCLLAHVAIAFRLGEHSDKESGREREGSSSSGRWRRGSGYRAAWDGAGYLTCWADRGRSTT